MAAAMMTEKKAAHATTMPPATETKQAGRGHCAAFPPATHANEMELIVWKASVITEAAHANSAKPPAPAALTSDERRRVLARSEALPKFWAHREPQFDEIKLGYE